MLDGSSAGRADFIFPGAFAGTASGGKAGGNAASPEAADLLIVYVDDFFRRLYGKHHGAMELRIYGARAEAAEALWRCRRYVYVCLHAWLVAPFQFRYG